MPKQLTLQDRIDGFSEWLHEGGNSDVADLIRDLAEELRTITAERDALSAALLEICQRIEVKPVDCIETNRERAAYSERLIRNIYAIAESALAAKTEPMVEEPSQ